MITEQKAKELFQNYNNVNFQTAMEFVAYVFALPTPTSLGVYATYVGDPAKLFTNAQNIAGGDANFIQFFDITNTTPRVKFRINAGNVFQLSAEVLGQDFWLKDFVTVNLQGQGMKIGKSGGTLGFFDVTEVVQQTVSSQATEVAANLATAISAINKSNTVLNSLRTALVTNGLVKL